MLNKIGKEFCEHSGAGEELATRAGLERVWDELLEASRAATKAELAEELADIVITVATCCHAWGIDLDQYIETKHTINLMRKWFAHPSIPGLVQRDKT